MSSASLIRAFVALELPEPVREALAAVLDAARRNAPGKLAWVSPESMHLTLAYLGPSSPERLDALRPELARAGAAHRPLELGLAQTGVFPSPQRPSVLWVGLHPSPPLAALQAEVAAMVRALGWSLDERPFVPHLTCARAKWPGALAAHWAELFVPQLRWTAGALSLMRSDSGPQGALYTRLDAFLLGA